MSERLNKLSDLRRRLADARRLLVVDLGFLGDTVHSLPALRELKRVLPNSELHVLSTAVGCEVLRLAPYVDRPILFPLQAPSPPWWKHTDILWALRRARYDLALSFSGSDRNVFITAISGARRKVIHDDGRSHFWRTWLVRNWVPRRSRLCPIWQQRRDILSSLGFDLQSPAFDLVVPAVEQSWASAAVPTRSIHFSINASAHIKEWPLEHWIELATRLLAEWPSHTVVITGSAAPREKERLDRFTVALSPVHRARVIRFPDPLTIPRLAAVLQRCMLHAGADSGVLHLAVALGVPTVSIFRDYEGLHEWQPQGPHHRSVVRRCDCEAAKRWEPACSRVARCLATIPAEEAQSCIASLLGGDLRAAALDAHWDHQP